MLEMGRRVDSDFEPSKNKTNMDLRRDLMIANDLKTRPTIFKNIYRKSQIAKSVGLPPSYYYLPLGVLSSIDARQNT